MATTALDMTLDDLIKQNKKPKKSNAGAAAGDRRPSAGPVRRAPNRARARNAPYNAAPKAPETSWKHDLYEGRAGTDLPARATAIETGTRLNISNLEYGVSDEDIKELFAEVGDIKRSSINYDRSGRSLGTAVVVFARRADALEAIKRYHNVQLDGKPIKIELAGRNVERSAAAPAFPAGPSRNLNGNANSVPGRIKASQRLRGGPGGPGGRAQGAGRRRGGKGRGGGDKQKVSAEDLDADLDNYHAGAMDTN